MSEVGKRLAWPTVVMILVLAGGLILSSGVASAVDSSRDKTIASALAAEIKDLSGRVESLEAKVGYLSKALQRAKDRAAARAESWRAKLSAQRAEFLEKVEAARNAKPPVVLAAADDKDCARFGAFFGHHDKSDWDHDGWGRDGQDWDDHGWDHHDKDDDDWD